MKQGLAVLTILTRDISPEFLEEFILPFPQNLPAYFKRIPNRLYNLESQRTLKTCSGFLNFHKKSLLFTSPYDIEITENAIYVGNFETNHDIVLEHPSTKFNAYLPPNADVFKTLIVNFGLFIDIKKDQFMIHSPDWHFPEIDIVPGILAGTDMHQLNFFINIKKDKKHIVIKQHDPLFLLTPLTEKEYKLNIKKYINTEHRRNFVFSKLKEYIQKTVFKKN